MLIFQVDIIDKSKQYQIYDGGGRACVYQFIGCTYPILAGIFCAIRNSDYLRHPK